MGNKGMARMPRPILTLGLMVIFVVFLGVGVLSFSPAYGGPETMGQSPEAKSGVRPPGGIPLGVEQEMEQDTGQGDADVAVMATDEKVLPVRMGEVSASAPEAAPFRQKSGFDAFNARYQNQWAASFSQETGRVRVLYGAVSRPYKNGPEAAARGFLQDSSPLFGLKPDLSDLITQQVARTPERDHVRLQQTYNGVPIDGVFVLVHATPQGRVTMVQNGYREGFQPANSQAVAEEAAKETAQSDLQAGLGKDATLFDPKAEQRITPYKEGYYYIWQVAIPTRNPFGLWVYHIDAESGAILYKADEILSTKTGKGRAIKTNADWHKIPIKISSVSLKNMYSPLETMDWGYLWGPYVCTIYDNNGLPYDAWSADYKFLYDYWTQPGYFDQAHAYYQMNTVWDWWNKKVFKKYGPAYNYPLYSHVTYVNWYDPPDSCNAFFSTNIDGSGPGFAFGDDNSCASGSADLVLDNDVVRHEWTHAMMWWTGLNSEFSGDVNNYGRAMGEGNADWFAFLNTPKDPYMADVAWWWSAAGYLRNLDNTRMYPWDVDYPAWGTPEEHYTGEIWGGYLYDLYRVLKSKALPYVYNALYYYDTTGGWRSSLQDFYDAICAQAMAEVDMTGKYTNSLKAWGSQASRGINGLLRINFYSLTGHRTYYHSTNYFYTGGAGQDSGNAFGWGFPSFKTVKTKGNILYTLDQHDYFFGVNATGLKLTATVTSKAGGAVNPYIYLYTAAGGYVTGIGPTTPTKCVLTYTGLPTGQYVLVVTANNTALARGYYDLSLSVK